MSHFWESAAFAGAVWMLTLALRRNRAAVRYGLWLAASVKFLVPFAWLVSLGGRLSWRVLPVAGGAPWVDTISDPFASPAALPHAATATSACVPLAAALWIIWLCGFAGGGLLVGALLAEDARGDPQCETSGARPADSGHDPIRFT